MSKRIRNMTEGALMIAIIAIMTLINRYSANLLEQYLAWVMPLPLLIFSAKHGLKDSVLVYATAIILAFIIALPNSAVFVAMTGITGIVYGDGVYRNKTNFELLFKTILLTTLTYVLTMIVFAAFFGYDVKAEVLMVTDLIQQQGIVIGNLQQFIRIFFAMLIFFTALLESILLHVIAHLLLPRLKIKVNKLNDITTARLPSWLGWILLGFMVLSAIATNNTFTPLITEAFITIGYISQLIFSICGIIVIMIYNKVRRKQYITMIVLALMLIIPQVVLSVLMVFGILDVVTDYRIRMMGWIQK